MIGRHEDISWVMSTQHPDHEKKPPFTDSYKIDIKKEIPEIFYVFSVLGCSEVMQDLDGKRGCNYLVESLVTEPKYQDFFKKNILGKDAYITIRIPNPELEPAQAKIVTEILGSISRSFDAARAFYKDDTRPPIFEVILPMTASADSLNRIYNSYKNMLEVQMVFSANSGEMFEPEKINVIPLYEDMESLLNAHTITKEFLKDKNPEYQRVFFARSDPALNYGNISAVLLNKIGLENLDNLSKDIGIPIYPIIGVGSAPFRGNLKPATVKDVSEEYPSVRTFTIQSSFKYDHPVKEVKDAIEWLKKRSTKSAHSVDIEECLKIVDKYTEQYQKEIGDLAQTINNISKYVPKGRERRMNIGLLNVVRTVGKDELPRAIPTVAAGYSTGIPPEFLGLVALDDGDIDFVKGTYLNFEKDLRDAAPYLNPDSPYISKKLIRRVQDVLGDVEPDKEHKEITDEIIDLLKKGRTEGLTEKIHDAARIRKFLG